MPSAKRRVSGDSGGEPTGPRYPIESVDNALRLLLLIGQGSPVSVAAAGRFLAVAPSTAHRLLAMLHHYHLIEQDPALKTYGIGPRLAQLGLTALRDFDIRAAARPHLASLVNEAQETAHLVILQGADVLFLDCVECDAAVRATSRTGQRLPAFCTAGGKAQLAQLSEAQITAMYPSEALTGVTPRSIATRSELLNELERARRAGYATNRRESEPDVHAAAAAIVDRTDTVRGAITVSGPPGRMAPARLRELGRLVRDGAAGIASDLD